jgi:hypothetical protein
MCQELWTSLPIWETQTEHNAVAMPYLLVVIIKSGEGTGLMIRLGDYCQGVARPDGFGLRLAILMSSSSVPSESPWQ